MLFTDSMETEEKIQLRKKKKKKKKHQQWGLRSRFPSSNTEIPAQKQGKIAEPVPKNTAEEEKEEEKKNRR